MEKQCRVLSSDPVYVGFTEAVYSGTASILKRDNEISILLTFTTPIPVPDGGVYEAEFPTDNVRDAIDWLKDTVKQVRQQRGGKHWEPDVYSFTRGNSLWAL